MINMSTIETLLEESFKKHDIVGLAFDKQTEHFYIGITNKKFNRYSNAEIWELNINFVKTKLIYQDSEGLVSLQGGVSDDNIFSIEGFFTKSTSQYISKSVIIQESKGKCKIYPSDTPYKDHKNLPVQYVSFNKLKKGDDNKLVFYTNPFVFDNEIRPITDYIDFEIPGKRHQKIVSYIEPLLELQSNLPNIPDLLVSRYYKRIEGYKDGKKISEYDFRSKMDKFMRPLGSIRQIIPKVYNDNLFLLLVGKGMGGANSLAMIKNFETYWMIPGQHGWPVELSDINNDQKDEIIAQGSLNVSIYTNINDKKPTFVARKTMPIRTMLNSLYVYDLDHDGQKEIITTNEKKLYVLKLT